MEVDETVEGREPELSEVAEICAGSLLLRRAATENEGRPRPKQKDLTTHTESESGQEFIKT